MTSSNRPRVSVVLPGKDAGEYVSETLASLLRQFDDMRDLEVVMIDDGSSDGTGEVVTSFANRLPNLTILRNERAVGLANARNQGLDAATGQYVAYLDADDWLAPGRLSALADAMDALDVGFLRTDHTTVAGRKRDLVRAPQARRGVALNPRDSILPTSESTMVDYPYAWAGIFDRAMAQDGFLTFPAGLHTAEDRPWIWNLFLNGPRYAVVDVPSLCYRRGIGGTLTSTYDMRQLDIIPALRQCVELVQADAEADRYLAKITRTSLALISHHVVRSSRMNGAVRAQLRSRSKDFFAALPREVLASEAAVMARKRARTLHGLLPKGVSRDAVDGADEQEARA